MLLHLDHDGAQQGLCMSMCVAFPWWPPLENNLSRLPTSDCYDLHLAAAFSFAHFR